MILADAGPWEFGWEALVAIGTLALAAVTASLVWTTRGLAQATAADLAAQWRPVIIPDPGVDRAPSYNTDANRLAIKIQNAGRGPALFIRVLLDPENNSPDVWSLGALGPGEGQVLTFSGVYDFDRAKQVLVDYRDLSGRQFASALVLAKVTTQEGEIYQ